MSLYQSIIGLPEIQLEKVIYDNPLRMIARLKGRPLCRYCKSERVWIKHSFLRKVRHVSVGERKTELLLRAHKYHCQSCKKYFNTEFAGILARKRASEPFRREVFEKHHEGIAQSRLSKLLGIGAATIERWYQDFLKRMLLEIDTAYCPKVLGIDEHFFSRKKGYATTFVDLRKRRVFDVVLGRSEAALSSYLRNLKGKEEVKVVVMDLSPTYRSLIEKYFPNAVIVADRFHAIRLINHTFIKIWGNLDPIGRKNRGLISLIRRHRFNLSQEQQVRLKAYLETRPVLHASYDFKQNLVELLLVKHQTARECKKLIPKLLDAIEKLLECPLELFKTLGKSLQSWKEEIARMWRFTRTNSIVEGLHNKMEVISRRAYGFKNFQNYRLRVRVLCGYSNRV